MDLVAWFKQEALCIKFDNSDFSCSRDMIGAHQNLNGSRDLTTPFSGIVCRLWTSTCYDQSNKFKISMSTHYEDMKGPQGDKNGENGEVCG